MPGVRLRRPAFLHDPRKLAVGACSPASFSLTTSSSLARPDEGRSGLTEPLGHFFLPSGPVARFA
jgi:hypothetical protein